MAESSERKSELIARLARSRRELDSSLEAVRHDLDVGQRLRHSIKEQKTLWLTGAAVSGWLLARLPGGRRRKESSGKRKEHAREVRFTEPGAAKGGLLLALLSFAATVLKPVITRYATGLVSEWMERRQNLPPSSR